MTIDQLSTPLFAIEVALAFSAIVLAVARRRGVAGTLAWIFAILAFPFAGALAYLLLANPSVRRTTRRKRLTAHEVRAAIRTRLGEGTPDHVAAELPPLAHGIVHLAARLTSLPPSAGNEVELLVENRRAFQAIEAALLAARESIWAEYYIIQPDETGKRFLDVLADRARAGVEVRLLHDAVGSARMDAARVANLRAAGGRVAGFLPLNPLRRRWAIHLRNHRKVIVCDGTVGFTGGMNIGDEYSGSRHRRLLRRGVGPWRDAHLAIRGPAVRDLAQTFAEDWTFATDERLLPPRRPPPVEGASSVVAVIPSGPDQEVNANALVYFAGVAGARARCWLTSPYFVPDEPMLRALESAALRGVDVRVLVPARSDVPLTRAAAWSYFPELVRAGVRVFEYRPAMLHAKTIVVDDVFGIVGSANVDVRSFSLNFEVGAAIVDRDFAAELEARFLADLADSTEITAARLSERGFLDLLREGAVRLLSPLL